jgi:hypothetical protein
MGPHEITRFPPILQLVGVGLLGAYVVLSLLGRVSPRLRWLWADADEARTPVHWLEYTILPALLLAGAAWALIASWNPTAPLTGGWTVRQLTLGPGLALLGVLLVAAASLAQRARESAVTPAPAWIPPAMMLVGLAALVIGVLALGRTVKEFKARERKAHSAVVPRAPSASSPGPLARGPCQAGSAADPDA